MIDLNYKTQKPEEDPIGLVILGVLPFCLMIALGVLYAL